VTEVTQTVSPPELPGRVDTILLDAGGVLLDLDYAYVRRLIEARHYTTTIEELSQAEARARTEINRHVESGGAVGDAWRDYFHLIMREAGVELADQGPIIDSLWEAHQRIGLWTVAIDGGPEAVAGLKRRGYRLGVVSNAEGRVEADLNSAGYEGLFETVVDSHLVGVQKPDPRIFEIALERMSVEIGGVIFVGDVPAVDVRGAQAAGLTPVLVDPHRIYADREVLRIPSIRELADLLAVD